MISLTTKRPNLVIAAHGSTATTQANLPFELLADSLRSTDLFSKVVPAFLDGKVLIEEAYDQLDANESHDVIVIPAMTCDGYYANSVFPKKLSGNSGFENFNTVFTEAIGIQHQMVDIVVDRIRLLLERFGLASDDTAVFIVGHGTRRNPDSGTSTFELARLANERVEAKVLATFIDQDPEISESRSKVNAMNTLVIPFLMGMGPHVTDDVPESFDLIGGPRTLFPRCSDTFSGKVICDQPLGSHTESLKDICFSLVDSVTHSMMTKEVAV